MSTHDETMSSRPSGIEDPRFGSAQPPQPAAGHQADNRPASGVNGLLDGLHERISTGASEQKDRAAAGLGGVAEAFHLAGDELRATNETLASYAEMASNSLRRMADQVRERGVTDMVDDLEQFARRRPGLFIGGAFLVGIGLARFLKSSPPRATGNGGGGHASVQGPRPATSSAMGTSSSGGWAHQTGPVS